ncbi:hypothetical protein, partial [Frankia sp. AgKG'84/4]|uniref:hypothetical protein n=1 Tax=Frankia sp. AgKG'84/4 TaxID=573490 RepID=UPI00202AA2AC
MPYAAHDGAVAAEGSGPAGSWVAPVVTGADLQPAPNLPARRRGPLAERLLGANMPIRRGSSAGNRQLNATRTAPADSDGPAFLRSRAGGRRVLVGG